MLEVKGLSAPSMKRAKPLAASLVIVLVHARWSAYRGAACQPRGEWRVQH